MRVSHHDFGPVMMMMILANHHRRLVRVEGGDVNGSGGTYLQESRVGASRDIAVDLGHCHCDGKI